MGNPVVHWELMSKEPGKVADFYARIFGWSGASRRTRRVMRSSAVTPSPSNRRQPDSSSPRLTG